MDHAKARLTAVAAAIKHPSLTMTDVACLLGHAEGAAFTRAFQRWTGLAPGQLRST
jgi:transcriptional regulator GlxA family with amidase domain